MLRLHELYLNDFLNRTPRIPDLTRKMCLNECLVPVYNVSPIKLMQSITPTDFAGFCNKERPQVGVIVITTEPGEDEGTPVIGK